LRRTFRIIAALTLAAIASLSLAAAAPAKARDRNHDRIPDRWEKRHHLSLKVKQARRDQDRDGLTNLGEYRAGLHPRDPDTDGDGTEDGDENAGRIVSFEGDVLTISLAGGGTLSAKVGEETRVKCKHRDEDYEKPAEEEHADEPKPEAEEEAEADEPKPEPESDEVAKMSNDGGEEGEEPEDKPEWHYEYCGLDDLVAGARVGEAQLMLHRGKLYWTKLELR
jgi:hypothetical protein